MGVIRDAAGLANSNARNFSTSKHAHFLYKSWDLLPKCNTALKKNTELHISDFNLALRKMLGFFSHLDPYLIFVSFRGVPDQEEINELKKRERKNLYIASKYMQCNILSILVLAELDELAGGDAPVEIFMGDLPEPGYISANIEEFIKPIEPKKGVKLDALLCAIMRDGIEEETNLDLKHSPLAYFLYGIIGDEGLRKYLTYDLYPTKKENARKLLGSLPKVCVMNIGLECA